MRRKKKQILVKALCLRAACLVFACLGWMSTTSAASWTYQEPSPPTLPSNAVCHGNSRWVAVGECGKIMHSTDGESWQLIKPLTDANLQQVIYAAGQFVAVGDDQTVLTSTDGIVWTHRRVGSPVAIKSVVYGAGVYVMIGTLGSENVLLTTANFSTWTTTSRQGAGDTSTRSYTGEVVLFDGSRFVAPVSSASTLTSADGYTWQANSSNLGQDFINAGDIADGIYYVSTSGMAWSSSDGCTWTLLPQAGYNPGKVYDLSVRGSIIHITMNSKLLVSYNLGQSWQTKYVTGTGRYTGRFGGLHWADSKYVLLIGDGGSHTSANGTWPNNFNTSMKTKYHGVCHGNGQFVAVGEPDSSIIGGEIRSSADGITWVTRHAAATYLYDVCYGNGIYVAVGSNLAQTNAIILTSTDLVTWTERANTAAYDLKRVIYTGGQFVAVGGEYSQAVILTSADGTSWVERNSNATGPLVDIIHANGLFVAVGSVNSENDFGLVTSPDGATWTNVGASMPRSTASRKRAFSFVSHGNGLFIAGTNDGYLYRSADGANWTEHAADDSSSNESWKVRFANGSFFAVTDYFNNKAYRSNDGLTWTPDLMGATNYRSLAAGDGTWVAVGDSSRIVTTPDVPLASGPSDVMITDIGTGNIAINWIADIGAKGHYLYYRRVGQIPWQRLAGAFSADTNSHDFTGLVPGKDYEFAVQTISANGLSALSRFSQRTFSLLDEWRVGHFGSAENFGSGANTFDADGDGQNNLVEYAIGRNPTARDASPGISTTTRIIPYSSYKSYQLETKFICDKAKKGIIYYIEISSAMVGWTRIAQSIGGAQTNSLVSSGVYISDSVSWNPIREVTVGYSVFVNKGSTANPARLFMRFGVEETP